MIIFNDHTWQTSMMEPDTNFLEEYDCEQPKWVVPDDSELAEKIKNNPHWEPVLNENGELIDITVITPVCEEPQMTEAELKQQLNEIDRLAIRPLRAIAAGTETEEDRAVLAELEKRAGEIREQLAAAEARAAVLRSQEEKE